MHRKEFQWAGGRCSLHFPAHARITSARPARVSVGGKCSTKPSGGAALRWKPCFWLEVFEADSWVVIRFLRLHFLCLLTVPHSVFFLSLGGRNFIHPSTGSRNISVFSSAAGWSSRSIVWGSPRTPEQREWLGICWPSCLFWRLREFSSRRGMIPIGVDGYKSGA